MVTSLPENRLDPDRQRKLAELSVVRGVPVSTVVDELIDAAYDARDLDRRRVAAERIAALGVEDMPDPETVKRQILSKYDDAFPSHLP